MRTEPTPELDAAANRVPRWCLPAVLGSAAVGFGLIAASAWSSSATYDEATYLDVAARWWRTGAQTEVTRMGTPLTFWKVQLAPTWFVLDHTGRRDWVDRPLEHQAALLPWARIGAAWVWLAALGVTAFWARRLYGPRAMAFAAALFALSPNLLAHGGLVTAESPLVAASAGAFFCFWEFLRSGRPRDFWASAVLTGLAFSCKFTAVVLPPLLALVWWVDLIRGGGLKPVQATIRVVWGMAGFGVAVLVVDAALCGFALMTLSQTTGGDHPSLAAAGGSRGGFGRLIRLAVETPIPQDWVGLATQLHHQRSGGPSYLLGERRQFGWWWYYFVALAVKTPPALWALILARGVPGLIRGGAGDSPGRVWMMPLVVGAFLAVTAAGSSRNYGLRYLLPMSPLVIVWLSGLAARPGWLRALACAGLVGQSVAVASVFPDELTYFNVLAGGRVGGRGVLADSNLDWGQGLRSLARLQRGHPEFRALTFYSFGETDPARYGVVGRFYVIDAHGRVYPPAPRPDVRTVALPAYDDQEPFTAVSASLTWGPWGPGDAFRPFRRVAPVAYTDDTTVAVYRTADLPRTTRDPDQGRPPNLFNSWNLRRKSRESGPARPGLEQ